MTDQELFQLRVKAIGESDTRAMEEICAELLFLRALNEQLMDIVGRYTNDDVRREEEGEKGILETCLHEDAQRILWKSQVRPRRENT